MAAVNLMSLPAEIRLNIFRNLFVPGAIRVIHILDDETSELEAKLESALPVQILRTNKQLQTECYTLLYQGNVFVYTYPSHPKRLTMTLPLNVSNLIKHNAIDFGLLWTWIHDDDIEVLMEGPLTAQYQAFLCSLIEDTTSVKMAELLCAYFSSAELVEIRLEIFTHHIGSGLAILPGLLKALTGMEAFKLWCDDKTNLTSSSMLGFSRGNIRKLLKGTMDNFAFDFETSVRTVPTDRSPNDAGYRRYGLRSYTSFCLNITWTRIHLQKSTTHRFLSGSTYQDDIYKFLAGPEGLEEDEDDDQDPLRGPIPEPGKQR